MDSVTVVICAYTEARLTTLRSAAAEARKQLRSDDELIVVVDHNDALLALCRACLSDCVVIPNHHNRGLSGARNSAVDRAAGSLIVFVDDDAVPLEGWLDALCAPYANECVYGVGGMAKPHWVGGRPRWFPDEFLWVVGCSHRGLPPDLQPVRNLIGANMSFRKTAFDHLRGFSETMGRVEERPVGCEETEFCIRLSQANPEAVLLYEPKAQVEHHVAGKRAHLGYFTRRCWSEGLSKAEVTRRVGQQSALSSERHYTSRVLPRGIWCGVRDGAGGDVWGAARSLTIILGLTATAAGYCVGTFLGQPSQPQLRSGKPNASSDQSPVAMSISNGGTEPH